MAHRATNGSASVPALRTLGLVTVEGVVDIIGLFGSLAPPSEAALRLCYLLFAIRHSCVAASLALPNFFGC